MITTLSRMYTDTLGAWAAVLFLIGAIAVLGSTLWAAVPSWSRMYTNFLSVVGRRRLAEHAIAAALDPHLHRGPADPLGRRLSLLQSPVLMVQIGGVMTGVFLLGAVAAAWYLRQNETDPRVHGGGPSTPSSSSAASPSSCSGSTQC